MAEYHRRATGEAFCDYGFHLILSNPTESILEEELSTMVKDGISSVKLYMTYEPLKLGDEHLMEVMLRTRSLGMTTMIHAENSDMIEMCDDKITCSSEFCLTSSLQDHETFN